MLAMGRFLAISRRSMTFTPRLFIIATYFLRRADFRQYFILLRDAGRRAAYF